MDLFGFHDVRIANRSTELYITLARKESEGANSSYDDYKPRFASLLTPAAREQCSCTPVSSQLSVFLPRVLVAFQ